MASSSWVTIVLLLSSAASITLPQSTLTLAVVDVSFSQPLYLGNSTTVGIRLINNGPSTITITGIIWEAFWRPQNITYTRQTIMMLRAGDSVSLPIDIAVPRGTFLGNMQYRIGINTTQGLWHDRWRQNIVRDYYLDAYLSLRSSIVDRLHNKKYQSPEANALATQAIDKLNDAEQNYVATREGYLLLLQANNLIDQAELAEAAYIRQREDTRIDWVAALPLAIILVGAAVILKQRRQAKRKTLSHELTRKRRR